MPLCSYIVRSKFTFQASDLSLHSVKLSLLPTHFCDEDFQSVRHNPFDVLQIHVERFKMEENASHSGIDLNG